MNHRRFALLLVLALALSLALGACAPPPAATEAPAAATEAPAAAEPVNITFWNAMSGSRGDVVADLVDTFNAKFPQYKVNAEYTGSYAETLTKALAAYKAGEPPTVVQVYEVGTQTMLDSGAIVPVYTLDKGDVNWDEVVKPIKDYYSVDGKLYCMPFNSSTAMLYYNKDMFKAAGLDPDKPPTTWKEVEDYSKQIMDAGVAEGGFSMGWPAWILEQTFAYHDQYYANNDNGRSGMATKVLFNGDFGVMVLSNWQRMAQEGVLVYGGRTYKANDPFLAGQFAMLFQSTSSLGGILKKANFEVGTAFLPRFEGDYPQGNSVVGGGCLWIMKGATPAQQEAAWEFLKYSFTPERAKIWHKGTGYFPTSATAYKELKDEGWFKKEPNHATAFNQILGGSDDLAARGVLLGNFVQIRDITGTAIEDILVNGMDPKETLDRAAAEADQVLADYAQLHGK
ncbi:MAG: ABC transporter substrate-binding protein [Chloroflexi bacterium]|nr:ABC transporter substrate-binding protein [Chloroflexota bacterium]